MIDDQSGRVNTDLTVVPAYGTAEAAIIQPERHAPLSLYAVQRWLPRLGGQRLALVLVLRALAFDAAAASDGTRRVTVSREALAEAAGVASPGTVGEWLRSEPIVGGGGWRRIARTCPEAEALGRFIPRLRYAYSGKVRTGFILCVRMDDPLAPEDEPLAQRIRVGQQTAAASQLSFTAVPTPQDPGDARKVALPTSLTELKSEKASSEALLKSVFRSSAAPLASPRSTEAQPFAGATDTERALKRGNRSSLLSLKTGTTSSLPAAKAASTPSDAAHPPQGDALAVPPPLKPDFPTVNVNDNDNVSYRERNEENSGTGYGAGPRTASAVGALSRAVQQLPRAPLGRVAVRHAVEPLVAITTGYLGDAASAAFFTKAYVALYSAGRLDLAVLALEEASDERAERPGAVFTAALKRMCAQEGVRLGLKGERESGGGARGDRVAAGDSESVGEYECGEEEEGPLSSGDAAAERLWQEAKAELEASMARSTYDTWLRNCELVRISSADPLTVMLAFPHQAAREWVSQRLRGTVERVLTSVAGRPATIECVLASAYAGAGARA